MSKQTINIGASPNDGTGTPLRTSFDYTNQNFTELYNALGGGVGLPGATTQVIFNDGGTNLAGDAGLVYNKTTDALTVAGLVTAGSATVTGALTVDTTTLVVDATNDRVGVNTATFDTNWGPKLQTSSASTDGSGGIVIESYKPNLILKDSSAGAQRRHIYADGGVQYFGYGDASIAEHLSIGTTGNVSVALGNVVMGTSGKGIDFSAVTGGTGTATGNVLNDYEEGAFTPTVVGTTADGTIGTYYANTGRYTKVGRVVTVQVYLAWGGGAGATGDLAFAGLPFTTGNIANNYTSGAIGYFGDIALTASNVPCLFASPNATRFLVNQFPVGGGSLTAVPYDNNGAIMFTATYFTA